jgi:Zn-dependent protease with chaperone function
MPRALRLLAAVLVVPLIGVGLAAILRPDPDPSYAQLCAGADADLYAACHADFGYRVFAAVSGAAIVGGLALLAAIAAAGAVARTDRRLLLALFQPGLHVTATIVTALMVIHAVLATVAMYAGVQAILPGTPMLFGGIFLGGALAGVRVVPRALFGALRQRRGFAFGGRAIREQAPELWRHVESIAERLGALPPDQIVLALETRFFVTEAPLQTPNGPCDGRTLCCSLPLMRILTIEEFTAVVAHELGHFRGEDTAFSQRFYPIYAGTTAAIAGLGASASGASSIALWPAIAIFEFFLDRFALAERRHSRARELLADAASVDVTSARAAAIALVKSHAFGPLWPEAFEQAANTVVDDGGRVPNASLIFAAAAEDAADPALLDGILETHTPHPTDTHPSLAVRLDALGVPLQDIAAEALRVAPAAPASSLAPIGVTHEGALSMIAVVSRRGSPHGEAPVAS